MRKKYRKIISTVLTLILMISIVDVSVMATSENDMNSNQKVEEVLSSQEESNLNNYLNDIDIFKDGE